MAISDAVNSDEAVRPGRGKKILRWLLKGLVVVFCLWLALFLLGRALRKIAVGQIVELTGAKVETKSVDVGLDGSVFIEELVIRPHKEQNHDDTMLKAETVYARFGIGSVVLLRPRLKEITVKDFVFDARYDLDTGQWNISALKIKAPKGGPDKMPLVRLERGALQYSKISNGQVKAVAGVPIEASFGPAEKMEDRYRFDITTAKRAGFGKSTLTGFWRPGSVTITGAVSSADVDAFERTWMINVMAGEFSYDPNNAYSMRLYIRDLVGTHRPAGGTFALDSRAFLGKSDLFTALQRFFNRYQPAGLINVELDASGNLQQLSESKLEGRIYCKDVSICDRKFPYAIEHIVGEIDFKENKAVLNNLRGEHGDVKVTVTGWSEDFDPKWQYVIGLTSENMALDNDLYDALKPKQKEFWSVFSPTGVAGIDYRRVRRSSGDEEKTLAVELLGAEATYRHFPYPLKNLAGRLLFDRENITFLDVVSQVNERKITVNGKVTDSNSDRPTYEFGIRAENIPLDSTLAAALPSRQREFYNQLDITGLGDAEVKIFTPEHGPEPASFVADVSFKKTTLKINKLPHPVSDISAKTVFTPDSIRIKNLSGRYGQNVVSLAGQIQLTDEAKQPAYQLSLHAEQVRLNDDLFGLLPESLKNIVAELQPEGKINCRADLEKPAGTEQTDYRITIDCLGNSFNFEPFPYPLEGIRGSLTITRETVRPQSIPVADDVGTMPGAATVKITGRMAQTDANLSGGFALDLEDIKIFDAERGEKYIDFAGTARFNDYNSSICAGVRELDAVLKIKGLYETGAGFENGRASLAADSLRIKGKSVTGLKAELDYDRHRKSWLTKSLTADCYDGRLMGKLELKQSPEKPLEYLLQVGFDDIDLRKFLSDVYHVRDPNEEASNGEKPKETSDIRYTSGKMSGSLSVIEQIGAAPKQDSGGMTAGADNYTRIGRCRLTITDMQVGQPSVLRKLLYALKLTEPKDCAFEQMLVDSYINDNKVFCEYLDLSGEAAALTGSGWMDLENRNLDVVLFTRGPRPAASKPSVLQSLTDGLGQAVVQIDVTGDFHDPKITKKTLSVFEETLNIFGAKPRTHKP